MAQTKLAATTSATQVLGADTARSLGALAFENSDTNRCFVLLDSGTPSATNYSFSLAQNEKLTIYGYAGAIQAVWGTAGAGSLMVTEWIN